MNLQKAEVFYDKFRDQILVKEHGVFYTHVIVPKAGNVDDLGNQYVLRMMSGKIYETVMIKIGEF